MGKRDEVIEPYRGSLEHRYMSVKEKRALGIWASQRYRCNNPKAKHSESYYGKGIKVQYSCRDFMGWYLRELDKFTGKQPHVGRINHDGDYCFENIRMESASDNSKECQARTKTFQTFRNTWKKKVALHSKKTHEIITIFDSAGECADFLGKDRRGIIMACRAKKPMNTRDFSWYYRFA